MIASTWIAALLLGLAPTGSPPAEPAPVAPADAGTRDPFETTPSTAAAPAAPADAPSSGEDVSTPTDAASGHEEAAAAPSGAPPPGEAATTGPAPAPTPAATTPVDGSDAAPAGRRQRLHTYPDRPIRWRLDLAVGGGSTFVRDTAFFAFTDARRHLPTLAASARVDVPLAGGRVFFGGGLGYRRSARGDVYGLYEIVSTDLVVHDAMVLARASVVTVEGVDVYAEAAAGPSIALLEVADGGADQRSRLGAFEALGGLALYLPKRWLPRRGSSRVSGGLDLGVGYAFRSKLKVRPELDVDDDAIPTRTTRFGDVSLRGLTWRAGVFVRFM